MHTCMNFVASRIMSSAVRVAQDMMSVIGNEFIRRNKCKNDNAPYIFPWRCAGVRGERRALGGVLTAAVGGPAGVGESHLPIPAH